MRIGFSGVHGSGKTTLLRAMIDWPELAGHSFVSGITRHTASLTGITINEGGTYETQKQLTRAMSSHVRRLKDLVIDRTLLDIYAYTVYARDQGRLTSAQLHRVRVTVRRIQPLFDIVFYLVPEFELSTDGVRSNSVSFQHDIAGILDGVMKSGGRHPLGTYRVVKLKGTVEERLAEIRRILNEGRIRGR